MLRAIKLRHATCNPFSGFLNMELSRANAAPLALGITIEEGKLLEGAENVLNAIRPGWSKDRVEYKLFTDGITNKLVGCFYVGHPEDTVLVRVYGKKTDMLIDRTAETRNMKLLHKAGYAPQLWATFTNGLAYEYVEGDVISVEMCRDPEIYPLVARMMAQIHRLDCGPSIVREPCLWKKIQQLLDIMPRRFNDPCKQTRFEELIPFSSSIDEEYALLQSQLSGLDSPVVFCHNDLLLGNIIYNSKRKEVTFIDYEYAGYNYQAYDIGNHFAEFTGINEIDYSLYPSYEFQTRWLRVYLETFMDGEQQVTDEAINKLYVQVNKFSLASHLFWGVWGLIQAEHSTIDFDFLEFAAIRFKEYFARKKEFLSLNASDL